VAVCRYVTYWFQAGFASREKKRSCHLQTLLNQVFRGKIDLPRRRNLGKRDRKERKEIDKRIHRKKRTEDAPKFGSVFIPSTNYVCR
jgi:hypothetical protein